MDIQLSLKSCLSVISSGKLKTFIPLLSIFTIKGKPLTLDLHYQFAPMFNTIYPRLQTWMTGRQVGKTWQVSASEAIRGSFIPFYDILHILPRDLQRTRYHSTILKPLLESSPIVKELIRKSELNKVLLKQFNSGSFLYLGTAYASADALRGISGCAQVVIDELADVDYDFIPVIRLVMSANLQYGYSIYAGTPTTTDTTCGILWDKSSQALWIIKCDHCNHWNIPNPEQDLEKMLGKFGLICAKCGKDIHPRDGGYIHAIPDRQFTFPGYHISQTIHPLHLTIDPITGLPRKWFDLLAKVNTYTKLKLYNEVYGWPYDESINPLTLKDLVNAQHDIDIKYLSLIAGMRHKYRCLAIGIDWDGGGAQSLSYTAACIAGLRTDSARIDILYGKRWSKSTSPNLQALLILKWVLLVEPLILAHDNGGAGFVRMLILKQKGLLTFLIVPVPFTYCGPKKGDVISFDKAQQLYDYYNYTLDKSRSLAVLIQAIKDTSVRLPKFNVEDNQLLPYDFLALKEDPRSTIGNKVVVFITRKPGVPDDWAHAVNFACSALWHRFHIYPMLGEKYDTTLLAENDNNFSPRSLMQQFINAIHNRPILIQPLEDD